MTQELMYKPRPCERCGAGEIDPDDFMHNEWEEESHKTPADLKEAPMCSEFHMAYGMVTWLCYKCRSDWHREIDKNALSEQYAEAQLSLDFWKARVGPESTEEDLQKGIDLLQLCTRIEKEINSFANNWLVHG
jgi:hypothetical protein